jgi:hypothetical protein
MTKATILYLKRYARFHKQQERKAAIIFYRALKAQATPAISHIENGGNPEAVESLITTEQISRAMQQVYVEVGSTAAKNEYQHLKRSEPTKADSPFLQFFNQVWMQMMRTFALNEAGDFIVRITDTTKELVREALAEAAERQLTFRQTAQLIRERTLGEFGRSRALTIARTEVSTAANQGMKIGAEDWAKEIGVELYIKWWARLDGRERRSHHKVGEENPIPNGDKFKVSRSKGGHDLMEGPCDISASGENRINCRCVRQYMSASKARRDFKL